MLARFCQAASCTPGGVTTHRMGGGAGERKAEGGAGHPVAPQQTERRWRWRARGWAWSWAKVSITSRSCPFLPSPPGDWEAYLKIMPRSMGVAELVLIMILFSDFLLSRFVHGASFYS